MLNKHLQTLYEALQDQEAKGIDCITPSNKKEMIAKLKKYPRDVYFSGWRYGQGEIQHKTFVHCTERGLALKEAITHNVRSNHPKLIAVYKLNELEELIKMD